MPPLSLQVKVPLLSIETSTSVRPILVFLRYSSQEFEITSSTNFKRAGQYSVSRVNN